jgi:hypothetical protein
MTTRDEFWIMADEARWETEYLADEKLHYLQSAPLEVLQKICLQYRYFTKEFPDNLALVVAKTPYGTLKSLIAEILAEELGNGNAERTHLKLYDYFLISLGLNEDILDGSVNTNNVEMLEEIKQLTLNQSPAYAIGLCGMGGECLCQVYLSAMHKNLVKNPYIEEIKKNIDWVFWDFHAGEADIIHRQRVREAINEIVDAEPSSVTDLAAGYQKAKHNWDTFWTNIYNSVRVTQAIG